MKPVNEWLLDKRIYLITIIIALALASQTRVMDDYVEDYTDQSIRNAAVIYAVARGINAVVSALQSSTVEVGVVVSGSVTVGEILDPINDLVERFSTVMTYVLASLAAQKLLLVISSNSLFLSGVLLFSVLLIASLFLKNRIYQTLMAKIFLIGIFLRFALVVAILMNSVVDELFIQDQTVEYEQQIKDLKNNLAETEITDSQSLGFFKKLEARIDQSISSFMNVMAMFILKTIVLPLLFIYVLLRVVKTVWRYDVSSVLTGTEPRSIIGK